MQQAVTVDIPAFVPANLVAVPQGATHFQLFIGAAAIDFEAATYEIETAASDNLAYNNIATAAVSLKANFTANSPHPLFLALGIEFMEEVNGKMYPLNNSSYNACSLIKVERLYSSNRIAPTLKRNPMHEGSGYSPAIITSAIIGTLVGMYKAMDAGTIVQTILLTALSAAISCTVSVLPPAMAEKT